MKRLVFCFLVILAGLLSLIIYSVWLQTRPVESTEVADCSWKRGGEPGVVTLTVTDAEGHPLAGLYADTESYSGWSGNDTTTDENGCLYIRPGEYEVIGIMLGKMQIMKRDRVIDLFSGPNLSAGLLVDVRVKDRALLAEGGAP